MKQDNFDIVNELMNISIALTTEKNPLTVLEMILTESRHITNADAGTIYLIVNDELKFTVSQNDTINLHTLNDENAIDWPAVKMTRENASGYVGLTGKILNIDDVYENKEFDFTGPRKYDLISGYRTKSMLVFPLKNHKNTVIGVIQLINAKNKNNEVVSFNKEIQKILFSLTSQAAISITNTKLIEEIENVFNNFVKVMVTSLDAQTTYNANHTRNMVEMARLFTDYLKDQDDQNDLNIYFDEVKIKTLITSIWLHDIGKIGIPVEILNKPTRLGVKRDVDAILNRIELIKQKVNNIYLEAKISFLTHKVNSFTESEYLFERQYQFLDEARKVILSANEQSQVIDDDLKNQLTKIYEYRFDGITGVILTPHEFENIMIYKGTLLPIERKKIEEHILITNKMLKEMKMKDYLSEIPSFVSKHHEFLDGSGYPFGIKADTIPLETRIITILDIFESLTSLDRPYRNAFSIEEALGILVSMTEEGKLDPDLVQKFIDSKAAIDFFSKDIESDIDIDIDIENGKYAI